MIMESKYRRRAWELLDEQREESKKDIKEEVNRLKYEKGWFVAFCTTLFSFLHNK